MAAKDGLLGKDLKISYTKTIVSPSGARTTIPFSIETEKFDEKPITERKTKHPIGEPYEHTRTIWKGWEIDLEGEIVDTTPDDLIEELELAHRHNTLIPELEVITTETYLDGTVRKYKYTADGGVRIVEFEKSGDGGDNARKFKMKLKAMRRDRI
ncbi:hypothetical protein SAMN04489735_10454 [Aneurinibacillus thermoaerophilus]|uniref:Phage tail tube protein n=1 Tax=Aneurinibacillus thermoaerophilus TaxID=143495 RepID=A0A1G8EJX2_ANETH|nr:hypothetical protein [Aneurinibacillus thermoaerophilus]QYY44782.1 hypothetical protein K3F53_18785 [Aneurinibacillus thermoaerophilus]SDH70177.1 hypothetical protein SAMN04489735_10454 [Aneurinibacillus thermoaerophilus]